MASEKITARGYQALLWEHYEALKARNKALTLDDMAAAAGLSRAVFWRALKGGPNVTLDKVDVVRTYLSTALALPEPLPPPVVRVESAEHHELVELGAELARLDPNRLRQVVTSVREMVAGLHATRKASRELGLGDGTIGDDDGSADLVGEDEPD